MLGFVEPVDLVHKENGPFPHQPVLLGLGHYPFDLFDPAGHSAEVYKIGFGLSGDDPCQRRFAHSRRAPEDHGRDFVLIDELPQDFPVSQELFLSHKFLQGPGAHPGSQGGVLGALFKKRLLPHVMSLPSAKLFFQKNQAEH